MYSDSARCCDGGCTGIKRATRPAKVTGRLTATWRGEHKDGTLAAAVVVRSYHSAARKPQRNASGAVAPADASALNATRCAPRGASGTARGGRRALGGARGGTPAWQPPSRPWRAGTPPWPGDSCAAKAAHRHRVVRRGDSRRNSRAAAHRLLRSAAASLRGGSTAGSTDGHRCFMSGGAPAWGVSAAQHTSCSRSRLYASSAAPEYLPRRVRVSGRAHTARQQRAHALQEQLQVRSRGRPRRIAPKRAAIAGIDQAGCGRGNAQRGGVLEQRRLKAHTCGHQRMHKSAGTVRHKRRAPVPRCPRQPAAAAAAAAAASPADGSTAQSRHGDMCAPRRTVCRPATSSACGRGSATRVRMQSRRHAAGTAALAPPATSSPLAARHASASASAPRCARSRARSARCRRVSSAAGVRRSRG